MWVYSSNTFKSFRRRGFKQSITIVFVLNKTLTKKILNSFFLHAMWSLINIKETVNMLMWYLIIVIFILKSQGYLKQNIFGE